MPLVIEQLAEFVPVDKRVASYSADKTTSSEQAGTSTHVNQPDELNEPMQLVSEQFAEFMPVDEQAAGYSADKTTSSEQAGTSTHFNQPCELTSCTIKSGKGGRTKQAPNISVKVMNIVVF